MDMVWHNHIFIHMDRLVMGCNLLDMILCHLADETAYIHVSKKGDFLWVQMVIK